MQLKVQHRQDLVKLLLMAIASLFLFGARQCEVGRELARGQSTFGAWTITNIMVPYPYTLSTVSDTSHVPRHDISTAILE